LPTTCPGKPGKSDVGGQNGNGALAALADNSYNLTMAYTLSAKQLVGQFGGPAAVRDLAVRHDVPLTYNQVRKWLERDSISSDGVAALLVLAEAAEVKLDIRTAVVPARPTSW
jgi:hypothetical protein